jgi:hypothetical protein
MSTQTKYHKFYDAIIASAKSKNRRKSESEYFESHHIIPKSLGGSNEKSNLVLLTAREHYIVHMLLVRMIPKPNKHKMLAALARFCKVAKSSKQYELYKRTMSKYSKGELNASFGKIWIYHTDTKEILYVHKSQFGVEYPLSEFTKGLPYQRGGIPEGRIWVHKDNRGAIIDQSEREEYLSNGWSLGKHFALSEDAYKNAVKARHTPDKDKKHSESLTGRVAVRLPDSDKFIRIQENKVEEFLSKGYILHKGSNMKATTSAGKPITIDGISYKNMSEASRKTGIPYHKIVKMGLFSF